MHCSLELENNGLISPVKVPAVSTQGVLTTIITDHKLQLFKMPDKAWC